MPNDVQIQMSEGVDVIDESISFLRNLSPLQPLEWDPCLAKSALSHVEDIGPKGLLQYQSSDETQPQERIEKFGSYVNSLGENIDFGPNDAIGVIISLTIDDGEEGRPHRENLFSQEYRKVGIACGAHKSEYEMCVMDFAYDFFPPNQKNSKDINMVDDYNNMNENKNMSMYNEPVVNLNLCDTMEGVNNRTQIYNTNNSNNNNNPNNTAYDFGYNNNRRGNANNSGYGGGVNNNNINQSPVVKLSLDNEQLKNNLKEINEKKYNNTQDKTSPFEKNNMIEKEDTDEFEAVRKEISEMSRGRKLMKKEVVITTKITYIYENGSTKEEQEIKKHTFDV